MDEDEIEIMELDDLAEAIAELRDIIRIEMGLYPLKRKKPRFLKESIKQIEWFVGDELGRSKLAR